MEKLIQLVEQRIQYLENPAGTPVEGEADEERLPWKNEESQRQKLPGRYEEKAEPANKG